MIGIGFNISILKSKISTEKKIDPIVPELKRECALVIPVYVNGKPMKPIKPIMERGGAEIMVRLATIKKSEISKISVQNYKT